MTISSDASVDSVNRTESCPVTARLRALTGVVVDRRYCRMGQDYDCQCNYCSDSSYAAAKAAADKANAETADHRAWIVKITTGFEALAQIGRAIRAAASPGYAYSRLIQDAGELRQSFGGNLRGFSFRVAGRRGSAKQHFGQIGTCVWIGESDEGTRRVGMRIDGQEKLAYCAASQLERIPMTAEVLVEDARSRTEVVIIREAIAPHRPRFVAKPISKTRPQTAYVVSGRDAGKHGQVFWVGDDKKTGEANARLGIRQTSGDVIWASAYDCADATCTVVPAAERKEMERVAADFAMEGSVDKARAVLAAARIRQA